MSGFSLKDHLFNQAKVEYLGELFRRADRSFPKQRFVTGVMRRLPELQLKQRVVCIAQQLEDCLPKDYRQATDRLIAALPPPLDPARTDDDFGDYIIAPLGEFVARNGLQNKNLKRSLRTLREITQRFSMEHSLRPFLRQFPDQTLQELASWVADDHYHVRRLVSEGTRPALPWSGKLELPVEATLPLLRSLHSDRTRYVTRSVANHLNDISRSDPQRVLQELAHWRKLGLQNPKELHWMTRHALRTLIKRGDPGSLRLLGFHPQPKITAGPICLQKTRLQPGECLEFTLELTARRAESLVVDYTIGFVKADGKRRAKTFKGTTLNLDRGQTVTIRKRHKLRADATTFRLYPGEHQLGVQVNGNPVGAVAFQLL